MPSNKANASLCKKNCKERSASFCNARCWSQVSSTIAVAFEFIYAILISQIWTSQLKEHTCFGVKNFVAETPARQSL